MTSVTTHHIVFTKDSQRALNEKALANNNAHILKAVGKTMNAKGWTLVTRPVSHLVGSDETTEVNWYAEPIMDDKDPNQYRNHLHFTAQHIHATSAPNPSEIRAIAKQMNTHGSNPLGGRWTLASIDGTPYEIATDGTPISTKDFTVYADLEIPDNFEDAFDHLYGLDSHIGRVKGALTTAKMSTFTKRFHIALIGPPGCGKSDICETLADAFGEDAVMKFDGTQTTAAGAIKQFDDAEIKPRVLIVEEIEKVAAEALSYLLAVMDTRGEIRKTTAKSKIRTEARILVIATVNNWELFDKILAGALSSRFANKLWFRHPDEATVRRILTREVNAIDGDPAWIEPAMAYAKEKNIHDPRMIMALCLCGQDGWLDGSYYKMLADTDKAADYDQK